MNLQDILHKTTYVWKDEEGFAIIIKNNGAKAILNNIDTKVWKCINDEDTVEHIIKICNSEFSLNEQKVLESLERLAAADLITNENLFWGDDIL